MGRAKHSQHAELGIVEFSKKGNGIGFIKQNEKLLPVEVPFTIPGDHIQASVQFKRRKASAQLVEISTPSPMRIAPKCSHFGICGGCRWQQLSYEEQLRLKEQKINGLFSSHLKATKSILPIIACEDPWQYRNKMEFTFSSDLSQNKFLGLIMDSSRGKVINLSECHLTNPWFIDLLNATREWWSGSTLDAYHHYRNTGSLRTLTAREGQRTGDRMVILTVSGNPDYALSKADLEQFVSTLRNAIEPHNQAGKLSIFLRIQQLAKGMATQFYEMLLYGPDKIRENLFIQNVSGEPATELEFKISPAAFFQPNTRQSERLYSLAIQLASISHLDVVYDLYCGTGTLSICLAKKAKMVLGIEICPEAVLDAEANAVQNTCANVRFLCGTVHEQLVKIAEENLYPSPDLVVVDPPRAGLDPHTINQLVKLNPKKILYISCNPVSQEENVKDLIAHGYSLDVVQPVDQFPHTVHIENIVVLARVDN
ncbi:MAG: 23S rRNA (uracil(1939)-C(5))-methyltransferase RlmD [Parachlamydia sp.]|nr:MAG: 23S rRNA (uracil(1939)-C(5))-methyltransferase RlmD [Parachlamydia sp.]